MILALFFGFFINVLLNFMISMAAFWFSEVGNLFSTVYIVQLLLSGGIFPLSIFGNVFKTISDLLPFSYTIQFPVNIITNKLSGSEIGRGIMMQIIWIGLSALAAYYLWKRGLRRYMAVGG
jgi:ABC-2 type transport system permease protein